MKHQENVRSRAQSRVGVVHRALRLALLLAVLPALLGQLGCGSALKKTGKPGGGKATLVLKCEEKINQGMLVTVDLVQVSEDEARKVYQLGTDWFYSDLRLELTERTKTVTVKEGCLEAHRFDGLKGFDQLAIVADYRSRGGGNTSVVEVQNGKEWKGKKLVVSLEKDSISVKRKGES